MKLQLRKQPRLVVQLLCHGRRTARVLPPFSLAGIILTTPLAVRVSIIKYVSRFRSSEVIEKTGGHFSVFRTLTMEANLTAGAIKWTNKAFS